MGDSGSSENKENPEIVSAKELSAVLSKDSRAVRELQSRLSNLGGSRSTVGRQLRDISSELRVLVPKVSGLKSARDKETAAVRELKAKREAANNEARLLSPEVKKALDAKEAAVSSLSKSKGNRGTQVEAMLSERQHASSRNEASSTGPRRQRSPWGKSASQLYSEMEDLEMKIITEAMPFSREQEIMKVIKEKRKQLEAVKAFSDAMKSHRELFSKFSELRRQSYAFHAELQKHADESQRFHEEMIKLIPRIKELRQKRKLLVGQFGSVKHEYVAAEASLQEKFHEISDVKGKLDTLAAARKKAEVEQKELFLTEKLKSGKKLTAKDLIMLQGQ